MISLLLIKVAKFNGKFQRKKVDKKTCAAREKADEKVEQPINVLYCRQPNACYNKTGLQPVSRPVELVHYFGGWVEGPSK